MLPVHKINYGTGQTETGYSLFRGYRYTVELLKSRFFSDYENSSWRNLLQFQFRMYCSLQHARFDCYLKIYTPPGQKCRYRISRNKLKFYQTKYTYLKGMRDENWFKNHGKYFKGKVSRYFQLRFFKNIVLSMFILLPLLFY